MSATRSSFAALSALCVALSCGLAATAWAGSMQWKWIGPGGVVQYSDQPPPAAIPQKDILSRPPQIQVRPAPSAASSQAKEPDANARALEKKLAEQQHAQEAAKKEEEAKRAAIDEQNARVRAQNCLTARQRLQALDSGVRLAGVNAQGQRYFMDDAQRMQAREQALADIAQYCR